MPIAPIDENGTVLYYEDTGVPPAAPDDYVTVAVFHGASFHSGVFKRVLPFAAPNKLRLVLLNARDYPGSTLYTPAELEDLRGSPDSQATSLATRAQELSAFIAWFIESQGIPPVSAARNADGTTGGGITLCGWSAGNLQTIPVLAHADKVPHKTRTLFDTYFRGLVIYAANQTAMGVPGHPNLWSPWRDPSLTLDDQMAAFLPWITGYYTQINSIPDWAAFEEALKARTKLARTPTIELMSAEDVAATTDAGALERSQVAIEFIDPSVYRDIVRRALYDCCGADGPAPGAVEPIWPKARVQVLWSGMDVGDTVWTAHLFKRDSDAARNAGKVARKVELTRIDGANHFAHWDEPERFVRLLASVA